MLTSCIGYRITCSETVNRIKCRSFLYVSDVLLVQLQLANARVASTTFPWIDGKGDSK